MYKINSTGKVLHMSLSDGQQVMDAFTNSAVSPDFIHLSHDEKYDRRLNIIEISHMDSSVKELLASLANRGFYVYMFADGVSRLVQHTQLRNLWIPVKRGTFEMDKNGIVYSLQAPQVATACPKLLVVFSSIHETMYTASLMRYFTQNFASIQKYIAPETIVLRIADVGGIVGSFYLNNKYDPNNADSIQSLISNIIAKYNVRHESVVLYGGSKGATGALYHGLVGHYGVVAVEPIVNDEHYYETYDDLHFTKETCFDRKKENEFRSVIETFKKRIEPCDRTRIAIIYSQRSPQKSYIEKHAIAPLAQYIRVYNSVHPNIKDHPDVARNAIPITLASINSLLYNLNFDVGWQTII